MTKVLVLAVFQFLLCGSAIVASNSEETFDNDNMGHLMDVLFKSYNKEIMPTKPVIVSLNLLLLKVKTIIERERIFESVIALFLRWNDPRIQWDPVLYNNVSEIVFNSERIWLPDVAMTNSAGHTYAISKDTTFVIRATYKGIFDFIPTGTAKTWCDLKLSTFPFDIQRCTIEFESWSLNSHSLLFNKSTKIMLDPGFSSLQFSLCGYSSRVSEYFYEMSQETFSRLEFSFVLKRKSSFYMTNLVFPIATLSMIQPLVFLIPLRDSSSDRVGFATTNLLTLVVFQTVVTEEMPKTSDAITTLSKYIISLVIMSGWAICESILIERLVRMTPNPPPFWLFYTLKKILPFVQHYEKRGSFSNGRNGNRKKYSEACREKERGDRLESVENVEGHQVTRRKPGSSWAAEKPMASPTSLASLSVENSDVEHATNEPKCLPEKRRSLPEVVYSQAPFTRRRAPPAVKTARREKANWDDVAARIDFLMFLLCLSLTIAVPLFLFLPIAMFGESCPQEVDHY